jgi:hypothetical protein
MNTDKDSRDDAPISAAELEQLMSDVIALREQVAQAELKLRSYQETSEGEGQQIALRTVV